MFVCLVSVVFFWTVFVSIDTLEGEVGMVFECFLKVIFCGFEVFYVVLIYGFRGRDSGFVWMGFIFFVRFLFCVSIFSFEWVEVKTVFAFLFE